MMAGMYAAISGLDANQTMLNETANDLANVNTVGYKAASVTFADSLTQVIHGASGPTSTNGGSNPEQVGLGVQVGATINEMGEGSFQSTNNPLDIAIEGNGFLRVGSGSPPAKEPYTSGLPANLQYTRAGDLTTNTDGFLTTQAGQYVIGRNAVVSGESETGDTYTPGKEDTYIKIPPGSTNVSIGQDGSVSYTDENPESKNYQQRVTAGYVSLATFPNESGLERLGGSLWGQTANSGAPIVGTPDTSGFGSTVGGELEMSNVDLATEMTNMITAERGYQANSRVISTADEMLGTLVTMTQ
jgi:flagellar hook protein FlgE